MRLPESWIAVPSSKQAKQALQLHIKGRLFRRPFVAFASAALEQRQHFPARAHSRADGTLIGRTGFHVLCAERNATDLLPCVTSRRRHADCLTVFVERSREWPTG